MIGAVSSSSSSLSRPWPAPTVDSPVRAKVSAPGSKSQTSRALLLAALAVDQHTEVAVSGAPESRDTALMVNAVQALGVRVVLAGERIVLGGRGNPGRFLGGGTVDCGLAGTVMRFVPPAAMLADGPVRFDGDPRARERPMGPVLGALRALGGQIETTSAGDALPFTLHGVGGLPGGEVTLDASASSQFISGLLLSGAAYDKGLTVTHDGQPLPSLPHIAMTVDMLRAADVEVDDFESNRWVVRPGPITARDWTIEPDLSNAAVFLAAAAATAGRVVIAGWPSESTQPGAAILSILRRFGCTVALTDGGMAVSGPATLAGIDVDLHEVGELAPTVAALAGLASGSSRLRGIGHLRGHETDRLAALATELTALGAQVDQTEDGLVIHPGVPRALKDRPWRAYADHRMATAGALLGLVVPGIEIDDIGCTAKTIPDFPARWSALVAGDSADIKADTKGAAG